MLSVKKKLNLREKSIIRSFSLQLVQKIGAWVALGIGLIFLKGHISRDVFGEIYQKLTKSQNPHLQEFFLGTGLADRQKLLNYALIFLGAIIFLNIVVVFSNVVFKLRDKCIENNKFYIYNLWIYILNSLARIASYVVLTLCFVSAQTLILILLFISLYTWFSTRKLSGPNTENFLTWQDPCVRKIIIFSTLVILILPFIDDRIKVAKEQLSRQATDDSITKLWNSIVNLINSVPFIKAIFESLNELTSFIHWIILIWYIRFVILSRISEYNDFWAHVNSINARATEFKQFYYYQKLLSEASVTSTKPDLPTQTKKLIILGDYGFLQITPAFLKKEYLERDLKEDEKGNVLREFSEKIRKIIEFINFLPLRLNPTGRNENQKKRVNFLIYCLFNEFQKFKEIKQTKKLILRT